MWLLDLFRMLFANRKQPEVLPPPNWRSARSGRESW